jgi:hypothetical protein
MVQPSKRGLIKPAGTAGCPRLPPLGRAALELRPQQILFPCHGTKHVLILLQPPQKPWENLIKVAKENQLVAVVPSLPQRDGDVLAHAHDLSQGYAGMIPPQPQLPHPLG